MFSSARVGVGEGLVACSSINFGRPGALLGSSVAFGSGCGQALPGVPRKAPLQYVDDAVFAALIHRRPGFGRFFSIPSPLFSTENYVALLFFRSALELVNAGRVLYVQRSNCNQHRILQWSFVLFRFQIRMDLGSAGGNRSARSLPTVVGRGVSPYRHVCVIIIQSSHSSLRSS